MSQYPVPTKPTPHRRWRRIALFAPVVLALVLCIAWSVLWAVAAHTVQQAIASWIEAEGQAGRTWTCADQGISGFPVRIAYRCAKPRFEGQVAGRSVTGSAGDLVALAQAYQPLTVLAEVAPPLVIRDRTGQFAADAQWTRLHGSYRYGFSGPQRVSLEWEQPEVSVTQSGAADLRGRAASVQTDIRRDPEQPNALIFALSATGASVPLANAITREDAPINLSMSMAVANLDAADGATRAEALDTWRRNGGAVTVTAAHLDKGGANLGAGGQLTLDDAHRLQGAITLDASGVEPLLRTFGIPTAALAIGSLLGGFGAAPPATSGGPAPLRLALTLNQGRVSLGPVRLPFALLPLY